ncbi:MAG: SDR family NAD(P)-dependent oxidoreductase [Planctomycetes bacterium]|nr:SDR family NAD(P)-dependent oxidoreductase [Planctomycetota bacterium]
MNGNLSDLAGRVVMVSGAAGNLGAAVVAAFRACGARLVLLDRAEDRLSAMYPELAASEKHLLLGGVDLASAPSVRNAVERAVAYFGTVDVLVNTVGGFRGGKPLHETGADEWDVMFELNVRTALNACRAVGPVMIRQKVGWIVNVASRAALAGAPNLAAYCAAKAAIVRVTESLAAELQPHGVTANCVLPGTLDTPQNREAMPNADARDWARVEEVAGVIVLLSTNAARAIRGAAIPVGGYPVGAARAT